MSFRALITITLTTLLAATAVVGAEAGSLDSGYDHMYNLQFAEAHQNFADWQKQHPDDPLGPVSDAAAYLFSEFDRLHILQSEFFTHDEHFITDHKLTPDADLKKKFDAALERAAALAAKNPQDADAQFAALTVHGLRSDYMALIEKRYSPAFNEMKTARMLAEKLLASQPDYHDAWVAIGVENYMLGVKPAPIRWLLRLRGGEADRTVGLQKLQITAEKGHYLRPFARLLLAVAALRDRDTSHARDILEQLARQYPHNPLYVQELARL